MRKAANELVRVVVIDNSPAMRDMLTAILQGAEGIQVVGSGSNGEDAVRLVHRLRPNVVTMDVRMPRMDGLEATRRIMRERPTPIVIVAGDSTCPDMDLTFEALKAGALTVVRKPGLNDAETCAQVVQAVRLMSDVPVIHHWDHAGRGASSEKRGAAAEQDQSATQSPPGAARQGQRVSSRGPSAGGILAKSSIKIIGLAASTGGPAALMTVLGSLPADFPLPILIVQHVTRGFAAGLAEWLDSQIPLRVSLAGHGETPQPGHVLLAPDDYHLQVNSRGAVELSKQPLYKGLRPSANYLFSSLARTFGRQALGIVLTGMGDDGAEGLEVLHRAGGLTMAQDESSCIVYGMPREAIARHAVDQVLSLDQIAWTLGQWARAAKEV